MASLCAQKARLPLSWHSFLFSGCRFNWVVLGPPQCSGFFPVIMTGKAGQETRVQNYLQARELQRSWKEPKLGLFVPAESIT